MENVDVGSISGMKPIGRVEVFRQKHTGDSSAMPQEDRVEISDRGAFASELVAEVSHMSDSRPEAINQTLQKVRGGNYPPPQLVEGLVHLMGMNLRGEEEGEASSPTN